MLYLCFVYVTLTKCKDTQNIYINTLKVKKKDKKSFTELIYSRIKLRYSLNSDTELATFLNITGPAISNSIKRNSPNWNNIITKCEDVSIDWILTGKGEMLPNSSKMDWECKVCAEKDKRIEDLKSHISVLQKLTAVAECSVVGDNLGFINQNIKNEVVK